MLDRNSQLVDDTRGTNPFPHSRPSLTWTSTYFFIHFHVGFDTALCILQLTSPFTSLRVLRFLSDSPSHYYMLTFPLSSVASVGHVCFCNILETKDVYLVHLN